MISVSGLGQNAHLRTTAAERALGARQRMTQEGRIRELKVHKNNLELPQKHDKSSTRKQL